MGVDEAKLICTEHGEPIVAAFAGARPRCAKCLEASVERAKAQQADEALARRRQAIFDLADEAVPVRYRAASLKDFSDPVTAKVRAWLTAARTEMQQLAIFGPVGTGKTHLACAITREIILLGLEGRSVGGKYTSQANYLRALRKTWDSNDQTEDGVYRSFTSPRFLVIDDVGAARGNENDTLRLGELISDRYDDMRPTVFVTNLTPAELKSAIGDRSYDRMRDNGVQIVLNGDSRRRLA